MSDPNEISYKVKAIDQASGVFQKVAKEAMKANEDVLKSLKSGLGEESKFGAYGKILAGGGAVAGLTLAGNELNKFVAKFSEIRKMSADGAGTGEIAEKLAISLPVFGSIIEAGRKFRTEMDGSAAAVERIAAATASVQANADAALKAYDRQKRNMIDGFLGQAQKLTDDLKVNGMSPEQAAVFGVQRQLRDEKKKAEDALTAYRDQVRKDNQPERDALKDEDEAAAKKLQSARDDVDEIGSFKFNALHLHSRYNVEKNRRAAYQQALGEFQTIGEKQRKLMEREDKDVAARKGELLDLTTKLETKAAEDIKKLNAGVSEADLKRRTERVQLERDMLDKLQAAHKEAADRIADIWATTHDEKKRDMGLSLEADVTAMNLAHQKALEKTRTDAMTRAGLAGTDPIEAARIMAEMGQETDAMEAQRRARADRLEKQVGERNARGALGWAASGMLGVVGGGIGEMLERARRAAMPLNFAASQGIEGGSSTGIGRAISERAINAQNDPTAQAAASLKKLEGNVERFMDKFFVFTTFIESYGQKLGSK
jgi:hypothetical protein